MAAAADVLHHWYRALDSKVGIIVRSTDPTYLKSLLYSARKEAADQRLEPLTIRTSPEHPESDIWIMKHAPQE